MITQIWNKDQWDIEAMNLFIDNLYGTKQKPSLSNLESALNIIMVLENDHIQGFLATYKDDKYPEHLILGNFESRNDLKVAQMLFNEAKKVAALNNCSSLLGPMNGSTWFTYRYSTLPKKPFFMETIHCEYYLDLWRDNGFQDFAQYQTNVESFKTETPLADVETYLSSKSLHLRTFNMSEAQNELRLLHQFCCELFANNVLYSDIGFGDFSSLYTPLLSFLDPDLIDFVFDGDQVVGLLFAVQDHLNPHQVIVKTIARNPDIKYKGLANIMASHFYKKALDMGFKTMLNAYFHIENKSSNVSANYGGDLFQRHVLLKLDV